MKTPPHRPPPHVALRTLYPVAAVLAALGILADFFFADPHSIWGTAPRWLAGLLFVVAAGAFGYRWWIRRARFRGAGRTEGFPLIPKAWRLNQTLMERRADQSGFLGTVFTILGWVTLIPAL